MPEHIENVDQGGDELWLPLTEYAVKSGLSTSTLRRKIKKNDIAFRVENGRYLIKIRHSKNNEETGKVMMKETDSSTVHVLEQAVKLVTEAFEQTLKAKDERIEFLEKRHQELKSKYDELKFLVEALEEKYEVRY